MNRISKVLTSLMVIGLMTGCGGSGGGNAKGDNSMDNNTNSGATGITMTLQSKGTTAITLGGKQNDKATIDWGDGSPLESITLGAYTESTPKQEHTYDQPAEYTVKITGNIEGMKCSDCGITTLDVNLSTLETLSCSGNRLTSLDMSHCPELKTLYCNVNKELSNLDISKNSKLEFLNCNSIKIENPDFSKNPELKTLYCNSNHLKSLDVSKNTKLTCLVCSYNEITTLDVSKNPDLEQFYCDDNKLTALDVSRNSKLSIVQCEKNQLSEDGLNALFNTLHNTDIGHRKSIYIRKNPGIAACDKSLAEQKEWIVVSE